MNQSQPNILQIEEVKGKYHVELGKHKKIEVETKEISEAYQKLTDKLKQSATKVLFGTKQPLTPKRKGALDKLMKTRKKKG